MCTLNLVFSKLQTERIEVFQFRNKESQQLFKTLTSNTSDFTDCFENSLSFEEQAANWRKVLDCYFKKAFKKIRVTNKPRKKFSDINMLMENLKKKETLEEKEEEELINLEEKIAEQCEELNRKKVTDKLKGINGKDSDLNHQGI